MEIKYVETDIVKQWTNLQKVTQDIITFSPRYKKGDLSTTWLSDLIFSLGWCENNTMLKISQEQEQYLASNNDQCQHLSFVSVSAAHISVHRTFHCSALHVTTSNPATQFDNSGQLQHCSV